MFERAVYLGRGYVRIHVEGSSAERFINSCRHRGIEIWDLKPSDCGYDMNLSVKDFRRIRPVVRKTHAKIKILKRNGLPFFLSVQLRHKAFLLGIFICIFIIFLLSRRIWNIEFSGNSMYTNDTLLKFLKEENVRNGMPRSEVDCFEIVRSLRRQYEDIVWVSASVDGTKLKIQIKENEDSFEDTDISDMKAPVDIVADTDATITKIITRKGIPMVSPGDKVKKGDILVSGHVPVNNDQQETIAYQYQVSDADITGETEKVYEDSISRSYKVKHVYPWISTQSYLQIFQLRVSVGSIQREQDSWSMYGETIQLHLGGFYLPVWYGHTAARYYDAEERTYDNTDIKEILSRRFSRYCDELEKKGVEIIENDVKIYTESQTASARGKVTVHTPVGVSVPSKTKDVIVEQEYEEPGDS